MRSLNFFFLSSLMWPQFYSIFKKHILTSNYFNVVPTVKVYHSVGTINILLTNSYIIWLYDQRQYVL